MKKAYEKTMAIDVLKNLCITRRLVRCDACCFVELPSGGYGVPYCLLLTRLNGCCSEDGLQKSVVYELYDGSVPKECKYWTSLKHTKERKESIERIRHAQNAIDKLKQKEKKQLRL